MKAVQFDKYGGIDVLAIKDVAKPVPGKGQVLVQVKAAGINPGEGTIREGKFDKQFPATFPSGQGSDLAGIVAAAGEDVENISVGNEVIGFTNNRNAQAEFALVDAANLTERPENVSWEQAGGLFVVGTTAYAAVNAVALKTGDTVVVSGAAGGVGSVAVQLAKNAGAKVIGIASDANHQWLKDHGIIPVAYGEGMEDRIRNAAGGPVDAFIDTYGDGYVDLALKLGVNKDRINTIIDFAAAAKHGVKTDGNSKAATADVLKTLAYLVSDGRLDLRVARTYALADVKDAYTELAKHHTSGKIVLIP